MTFPKLGEDGVFDGSDVIREGRIGCDKGGYFSASMQDCGVVLTTHP
jgi:hypothetical protein